MSRDRSKARAAAWLLGVAVALAFPSAALAAGKPVNVGTPFENGPPAIAVNNAGEALIAWANTKDLAGANNFVQYCVLPVGATACAQSGNLIPADGAQAIDGVQVLNEGSTLVILADVYGTAGNSARDYVPEQEWQSTDGGATWSLVNGGLSVTSGIINADTGPLSAVTVPGTGVLGYGWDTAAGPPTFNAFPLSSPPECSVQTCPAGYATLEPNTNPDTIGNGGGQYASQAGAQPGVLGIFNTLFTNGPLGCSQSFGTAYAYGSGDQSASNNYNISPGQPGSAWKVAASQADCNVEYPAVAGGPSGFGVLEANLGSNATVYHRFDPGTEKFDTPMVTVASQGEESPALAQDGAGDIYATYLLGGVGGPIELSYSGDGGSGWTSAALNPNKDGGAGDVNSSVNSAGQGWATWDDNGSVFAQSFQAADAISPAIVSGSGTSSGSTVTVNVSCASFPCTITITLTAPETVVVHAAAARVPLRRHKKTKIVTLGSGKLTIKSKGSHKLTVHLSGKGKSYVKSHKGHFKATALISAKIQGRTVKSSRTIRIHKK
jgi:hypothetical protein